MTLDEYEHFVIEQSKGLEKFPERRVTMVLKKVFEMECKLIKLARAAKLQLDRMDAASEVTLAEFGDTVDEVFGDDT